MTKILRGRAGLSLGGVLLCVSLSSCGGGGSPVHQDGAMATDDQSEHSYGAADDQMANLPAPKRLAFMMGHMKAGLALYRAGEPGMAAPHLLHPVSEMHEPERAGLDELGFNPEVFKAVSIALEEGRPASEVEPMLLAAEANLAAMATKAGADPADIITYLMDVLVAEYMIAVQSGGVSDIGEYQDAYGFAMVAIDHAQKLAEPARSKVLVELGVLVDMWPNDAPIPPAEPATVAAVITQTAQVLTVLSTH